MYMDDGCDILGLLASEDVLRVYTTECGYKWGLTISQRGLMGEDRGTERRATSFTLLLRKLRTTHTLMSLIVISVTACAGVAGWELCSTGCWQGDAWTKHSRASQRAVIVVLLLAVRGSRRERPRAEGGENGRRTAMWGNGSVYSQYFRVATVAIGTEIANEQLRIQLMCLFYSSVIGYWILFKNTIILLLHLYRL
jgi:hypothetical protein